MSIISIRTLLQRQKARENIVKREGGKRERESASGKKKSERKR